MKTCDSMVRIDVEWRDWCGRWSYQLREYIPARRVFFWRTRERWDLRCQTTFDRALAERWATHYNISLPCVPARETSTFPNPLCVRFGRGRILMTVFKDEDGHGVILRDTGEVHQVGENVKRPPEKGVKPKPGEIFLHFTNVESVLALRQTLDEAIAEMRHTPAGSFPTDEVVERYIRDLPYTLQATEFDKALVAGNVRSFARYLREGVPPAGNK